MFDRPSHSRYGNAVRSLLLLSVLCVAVTVLRTEIPPLGDYPNHLARYWLLAGGVQLPPLQNFYEVDWSQSSVIAIDILAAALCRLIPYTIAGKILVIAALAGPPAGAACLSRKLFGRWHWWQLSFIVFSWTTTGLFGFLNYQIGLALALFSACLDDSVKLPYILKLVIQGFFGLILFTVHPFGLVFYMLLLLALNIGNDFHPLFIRSNQIQIAKRSIITLTVLIVPVALVVLLSPTPPGAYNLRGFDLLVWRGTFKNLLDTLGSPFLTYDSRIDFVFMVPLFAILAYSIYSSNIRAHAGMITVGIFTIALAIIAPFRLGDEAWVNIRLPFMATLLLFTGLLPEPFGRRATRSALTIGVLLLAVGRTVYIDRIWQARESDVLSIESAISLVPQGATVFTVQSAPADIWKEPTGRYLAADRGRFETTLRHVPALVVPQRRAFIPSLFSVPGQQPLRILPPWDDQITALSPVPDVHSLNEPDNSRIFITDPYLRDWQRKFDYIIMIGMDHEDFNGPFVVPRELRLVSDNGYARLYQVVK